jgi:hypothetical protein
MIISKRENVLEAKSNFANLSKEVNPPPSIIRTYPKRLMVAVATLHWPSVGVNPNTWKK